MGNIIHPPVNACQSGLTLYQTNHLAYLFSLHFHFFFLILYSGVKGGGIPFLCLHSTAFVLESGRIIVKIEFRNMVMMVIRFATLDLIHNVLSRKQLLAK